jgi:hypothetical protein
MQGSTQVSPRLALKYKTRVEVAERQTIGLDHPLNSVTNSKYKLTHSLTTIFLREEGTSF